MNNNVRINKKLLLTPPIKAVVVLHVSIVIFKVKGRCCSLLLLSNKSGV